MGPLCGIFDQRAAEKLTHHADRYGFDAISVGGVLSWLMECLSDNLLTMDELGIQKGPVFSPDGFSIETDSMHNATIGAQLLDSIVERRVHLDLEAGARRLARHLARERGKEVLDLLVYTAFGRRGWMAPNQYWTPGVLSPMPIMGKYYMYYGDEFLPPRELGRKNAERFKKELILDNMGICRFHRNWAEEMVPEIIDSLYGLKEAFLQNISMTASRINSRNASVFWESERNFDYIYTFLKRRQEVEGDADPELLKWIAHFERDKKEAAFAYWYEVHKGIHESLREF
jgi:glyceraldehyde-3-phosphate dehydrogenase (ferredoxin)